MSKGRWTFLQGQQPSNTIGQTGLPSHVCSQYSDDTALLGGELLRLMAMTRAESSPDGINCHVSVTKLKDIGCGLTWRRMKSIRSASPRHTLLSTQLYREKLSVCAVSTAIPGHVTNDDLSITLYSMHEVNENKL